MPLMSKRNSEIRSIRRPVFARRAATIIFRSTDLRVYTVLLIYECVAANFNYYIISHLHYLTLCSIVDQRKQVTQQTQGIDLMLV